jgi:hypothetical protein
MSPWSSRPARHLRLGRLASIALLLATVSACSSMSFTRKSETHGEFYANGIAVTILGIDLPRSAVDIARENLSDARQPNMRVREQLVFPYFGVVDWILDIFSIRYASISGTWGFPPVSATDESSN